MEVFVVKTKILYTCLGLLISSTVLLSVYIATLKPDVCGRVHLDDVLTVWNSWVGEYDIVPDEETARKIADIVIETRNKIMSSESSIDMNNVSIIFNEKNNEWEVYYGLKEWVLGWGTIIYIRRDNGMIVDIGYF
jgi:hypothetical protein